MTLRLQNLMLVMLLALTTLFVGFGTLSQNPRSGGYQLFERAASGISADIQLASLENFAPSPETAPESSIAPNRTSIETSNGDLVRPADSLNYSVATEVQLPSDAYPGVSRRRHNQISNQALHEAFEASPTYAAQMENLYPGILDGVRPGPRGA